LRPDGLPPGFAVAREGRASLVARRSRIPDLERAGLCDPACWERLLAGRGGVHAAGRGRTAVVELSGMGRARVKRLLRGGLVGPLWGGRYAGRRRLLHNVIMPLAAAERGIATPAPIALLLVEGPPALYRAWLATEEVADALDLAACFASGRPPDRAELATVAGLVRRMHDRGLTHGDLNLGNVLLRRAEGSAPQAVVIDLDRARLHPGPLGLGPRLAELRRLERSCVKSGGPAGAAPATRRLLYELYAAGDAGLASLFERGRRAGELLLFLHRLHWRR
jgi:hypothetical protein